MRPERQKTWTERALEIGPKENGGLGPFQHGWDNLQPPNVTSAYADGPNHPGTRLNLIASSGRASQWPGKFQAFPGDFAATIVDVTLSPGAFGIMGK